MPGGVAGEQAEMPASYADFRIHQSTNRRISSRIAITAFDTATTALRTTINTLIIRLLHTEPERR